MSEKPEALRLAERLENVRLAGVEEECWQAAQMLRLQHAGNMGLLADNERLTADNERLREALKSIAANACCDRCQEAALVAKAALQEPR